jgi:RNA polymerase sigma-70 factor (ECF subfamily)
MATSPFEIELDEITLAQARRGQPPACERIFRAFQGPAYSVAFRICQSRETAEEVTQEAFITAFRKIRQFRGDAPFWGWLRRVVVNHAITTIRRASRVNALEFQDYLAATDGEQESVGMAMDLESALARLDTRDRAVVWLHDVEGYGHQEIAILFGKTESFSKTRLSRARARLRAMLEDAPAAEEGTRVPGTGRLQRSRAGLEP